MSTPDFELDKQLRALFGGLDTRPDFDARLMARLRAESQTDATERVMQARQRERARYRRAVSELRSWRRSALRLLTLDTLGIALLLAVAVVAARPRPMHLRKWDAAACTSRKTNCRALAITAPAWGSPRSGRRRAARRRIRPADGHPPHERGS